MSVTVGVDGGQSQIRLCVSGEPRVASTPGVSHLSTDMSTAVVDAVARMWAGRDDEVTRLVAGLTTVPASPNERSLLASRLASTTRANEVWLGDDHVTSHAGAFSGATGVILSVGTGVACLAVDAETGAYRSFDGAGYLVGDLGGGFWLGRHGIRAALAADEGRGPRTSLGDAVAGQLGPLDTVATFLHSHPRAVDTISQMAVVVLSEAAAGDTVAAGIAAEAAARLVDTASAGVRFLSSATDVSVALGGRLMLENHRLGEAVSAGLAAAHPSVAVSVATGSSLDGARTLAEWVTPGPYQGLLTLHGSQP